MSQTNTLVSAVLKQNYSSKLIDKTIIRKKPLLEYAKRARDFNSQDVKVPVSVANNENISADFSVAQAMSAEHRYSGFTVTPKLIYGVGTLNHVVVDQAANGGDVDRFVDVTKNEFASVLEGMGQKIARHAYGNGGGAIARAASTGAFSTTVCTLADPAYAVFFKKGMRIQLSDTDGTSGSLRDSGDYVTLVSVDPDAGTLTADANWSSISGAANSDYLFAAGNFGAVASGLDGWNPATVTATSWYGVDRTTDPTELAGVRYDATTNGDPIDTAIPLALRKFEAYTGLSIDVLFMNPGDIGKLEQTKEGGKWVEADKSYGYELGIKAFSCHGVDIVSDHNCPPGVARGLVKGSFTWKTCGTVPNIMNADGLQMERVYNSADYQLRASGIHNFLSEQPRGLLRIKLY